MESIKYFYGEHKIFFLLFSWGMGSNMYYYELSIYYACTMTSHRSEKKKSPKHFAYKSHLHHHNSYASKRKKFPKTILPLHLITNCLLK